MGNVSLQGVNFCPKEDDMRRITPQELHDEWRTGEALVLDVRSATAFAEATEHIPGDVRYDPDDLEEWTGGLPTAMHIVAYCT